MMILVLLGGQHAVQLQLVDELRDELKSDFQIIHIDNDPATNTADSKRANLSRLAAIRQTRDTVTIITGVNTLAEYDLLARRRAVFCIIPGELPRLLARGEVPITRDFLYVADRRASLDTDAKRRVYGTMAQAFSECFARELRRG